ncbi:MAG: acyl-CoA thioesterase, partial [Deltaproteobacteria bacterium]|nr:acyl-CoA thioesterase [Deltaproteobacteria bacterium]
MLRHMTEIRVDWGDTDRADVVYYPNYFHYFNIAENELFRSTGRTRKALMEQYRIRFPRREVFCQFHRPALWDDLL